MMNITSGRLIFHRFSTGDFQFYYRLVMNEDVMKYITGKSLTFELAELRFRKALDANDKNPRFGFFIVKNKLNEELVGVAKLVETDTRQAEVGYMLLPEHWGKGYASEMVECMIRLASEQQTTDELIGIVDPENTASIRVLTKFGFQLYETGKFDGLQAAFYKLALIKTMPLTNNE